MKSNLTRRLLFFVAIFTTLISNAQNCLPDGISFYNQSEIDNFAVNYPGCTHIGGDVLIGSNSIMNLNGLSQLQSIEGDVSIYASNLASLEGLNNITSMHELTLYNTQVSTLTPLQNLHSLQSLYINPISFQGPVSLNGLQGLTKLNRLTLYNVSMFNLGGLENIDSFQHIDIRYADLTSLDGLQNADYIGMLSLYGNEAMTTLAGLETVNTIERLVIGAFTPTDFQAIQHITKMRSLELYETTLADMTVFQQITEIDTLKLSYNDNLLSLNGLQNIKKLQHLNVSANNELTSLNGLENVTDIHLLEIQGNLGLTNLTSLQSLKHLDILDTYNPGLTDLSGLEQIDSMQKLSLYVAPIITSLNGLSNLKYAKEITLLQCTELTDLHPLQNVTTMDVFSINNCAKITDFQGLNQLTALKQLFIYNCENLTDISSLSQLGSLSGPLEIYDNNKLTSLQGLHNLDSIGSLTLLNNVAITTLEDLSNLQYVGGSITIQSSALTDLHGLENVKIIGDNTLNDTFYGSIAIYNNLLLTNLSALQNLQSIPGLYIENNPQLSLCSAPPICAAVYNFPQKAFVSNNAPGCNSNEEILDHCSTRSVTVEVLRDDNATCASGLPVPDLPVRLVGTVQTTLRPTDQSGKASFKFLEQGDFNLELPQINSGFWNICELRYVLTGSNGQDSTHVKLFLSPKGLCPNLIAKLNLPPNFRGCLVSTPVGFSVRNEGTYQAINAVATVVLPSVFDIVSTDVPISNQQGDTLYFNLGDVQPLETKNINITVITQCGADVAGHTLCVEGFVKLDNPCPEALWGFSEVVAKAECINEEIVRFTLKNIGDAPTLGWHEYKVIRNTSVVANYSFSLNNQQSLVLEYPADGATWRIEATHLDDGTQTAAAIEGCNGLTPGLITSFWLDHGPDDYDFDCRQVVQAYDPNEKTAIPGFPNNEITIISGREPIFYTIHFQNTGTDTAFRVQLIDNLSERLDLNTFQAEGSSHPCTWELRGNKLEVLFQPIALPDINVSEPNSRGFFRFSIQPKENMPLNTGFFNNASIIFDFNPAITTNTVYHLKGQLTVSLSEPVGYAAAWEVFPNPTSDRATFRSNAAETGLQTFVLYDLSGRVVRQVEFEGSTFDFQSEGLTDGLYLFRIQSASGRTGSGKMMVVR